MTDDMMTLRALLEKSSDADLLREMIGFAAEPNNASFDTWYWHTTARYRLCARRPW